MLEPWAFTQMARVAAFHFNSVQVSELGILLTRIHNVVLPIHFRNWKAEEKGY